MDRVSNVDRLVALLQQRLEARKRGPSPAAPRAEARRSSALARIAALNDLSEPELKHALIESLLADQFGANLINDAQFQQMTTHVLETIDEDQDGHRLLAAVVADLKTTRR